MHAGQHYTFKEVIFWTRRDIYKLTILATVPTLLYHLTHWPWLTIPWLPVAMIGTAVAFMIGFRNTQTYNRVWEARTIWGGIVNASRTWGIQVKDHVRVRSESDAGSLKSIHQELYNRHFAWLTALRYQLREPRNWETMTRDYNVEFRKNNFRIQELDEPIEDLLKQYLTDADLKQVMVAKNKATQLIALQSATLKKLHEAHLLDDFRYNAMHDQLKELYDLQGRCERIKNFPYPRQFATTNLYVLKIFIFMVPLGLLKEFDKLGPLYYWLNIPFSLIITWIFSTMEKIGEATENPFEGSANDVPITALSRTIEIDMRQMLGEKELPPAIQQQGAILM